MNPNELFIRVFDELEAKYTSNDQYDVLQCARLLRQLLLDEDPLTAVANRVLCLKVRYDVNELAFRNGAIIPSIYIIQDGIDPETALHSGSWFTRRNRITCNRDKFLRQICVVADGKKYSVRDVIKYLANTAGGVHYTSAPDEEAKLMRELDQTVNLGGQQPIFRQPASIANITLRALRPLRDKLYAQLARGS